MSKLFNSDTECIEEVASNMSEQPNLHTCPICGIERQPDEIHYHLQTSHRKSALSHELLKVQRNQGFESTTESLQGLL
jgi:hypothetical protein